MIYLNYHQAQAVAERAERVRMLARRHRRATVTESTRVVVSLENPTNHPEHHGYYLHVEGYGSRVPLFAIDLGYPRNFEATRLPARDEEGHVNHPDMEGIGWDEFDMGPQLRALGWHSKTVSFEDDASEEARERYSDAGSPDCSYWTPTTPEGAGWLLASIYDTEEGPVALFVRDADGVAPAAPADLLGKAMLLADGYAADALTDEDGSTDRARFRSREALVRFFASALGVAPARKITSVAEFCAEGQRLGLTAADLAEALKKRPEFADCLPDAAGVPVAGKDGPPSWRDRYTAAGVAVAHGQPSRPNPSETEE